MAFLPFFYMQNYLDYIGLYRLRRLNGLLYHYLRLISNWSLLFLFFFGTKRQFRQCFFRIAHSCILYLDMTFKKCWLFESLSFSTKRIKISSMERHHYHGKWFNLFHSLVGLTQNSAQTESYINTHMNHVTFFGADNLSEKSRRLLRRERSERNKP